MALTNAQFEELRDAICAAFDKDSLKQLVYFGLGLVLEDIVNVDKPLATVAFELIRVTEQHGTTPTLVRAIYEARPRNEKVLAYCQQHAAFVFESSRPPKEVGKEVKARLFAVAETAQQPQAGRIRAIIREFRESFAEAQSSIGVLEKYKALHGYLHTIDFGLSAVIARAADAFRQSQDEHFSLHDYTERLNDQVEAAARTAAEPPASHAEDGWITNLRQVVEGLRLALAGAPNEPQKRAVSLLKRILAREPSRINGRLFTQAQALQAPLQQLTQALREVQKELAGPAPAAGAPRPLDRIAVSLNDLEQSRPRLLGLIAEHDFWQEIDNQLRLASDDEKKSLDELQYLWPDLARAAKGVCDLRRDSVWARQLQAATDRFTAAQGANDPFQQRIAFTDFRRIARTRFFDVDTELHTVCGSLVLIGEPLRILLEVIDDAAD